MKRLLPSEFLEAIGQISVNFGYLERMVLSVISKVTSVEPSLINRLIAGDNFEALVSKFEKSIIFQLRYKNLIKKDLSDNLLIEVKELTKKIDAVREKRNTLIHSFWVLDEDGIVTRTKFKKRTKTTSIIDSKTITLEALNDIDERITDCVHSLAEFKNKIIVLLMLV